ncbi:16S rRNA (uracil(1498)-N(3))-methyltransferase [Piscinibacter sp. XHJ-5]|uniref:16S rRNA (uracil(1498)-N(3))-methyltransferase n=1 Tax=Piscinibacter sp. XHJ-5 TaxID=3037797 RepID=UPI0024530E4F|nr:16S rRNA (uracil(1498)-N(3))-methyltransferase [Piscinibacter sp. XHJ-5]
MTPRLHLDQPLAAGTQITLPAGPSRHVQVLRLQPGAALTLFNGAGGEWSAHVVRIGRRDVEVEIGQHDAVERETARRVTLAVGMPANERMDALIEKATELGVAYIQPLLCERSVLRLNGDRAHKRVAHWRGVAVAASEQSGRTRVPRIGDVLGLREWLDAASDDAPTERFILSLRDPRRLACAAIGEAPLFLSGPEGGLTESEEAMAVGAGFMPVSLGTRTLRADTAPLAVMAALALLD